MFAGEGQSMGHIKAGVQGTALGASAEGCPIQGRDGAACFVS